MFMPKAKGNAMREEFVDWFNQMYLEWQLGTGRPKKITDFGDYLGIDRSMVSRYLSGEALPSNDNTIKIANRLGDKVYDLLGWEKPAVDPDLEFFKQEKDRLTKKEWRELLDLVKKRKAKTGPLKAQNETGS